jgi:hypothetical protein
MAPKVNIKIKQIFFLLSFLWLGHSAAFGEIKQEKELLFSEDRKSLEKGVIHISSAFLDKEDLLYKAPEIEDFDYLGVLKDDGVKYLFSKVQFMVNRRLSLFTRTRVHNAKGFEKLSKNVVVKRSIRKSETQIDLFAEKSISLTSFESKASFFYLNPLEYEEMDSILNMLDALMEGKRPNFMTLISTEHFTKFFNKALNVCFYEGQEDVAGVLITCYTLMSLKKEIIRKFGWVMNFEKSFRKEVLYTTNQIKKM